MIRLTIQTNTKTELVDITSHVQSAVDECGLQVGACAVFVPHTTAGVTLNENWDPDVKSDILLTLDEMAPAHPRHQHGEGNSPAHIRASLMGASALVLVEGGRLQLGSWQGIYLAEFDGPRRRNVWVTTLAG
jgi:secondary thiamine-phosphate synthase enzyme